MKIVDKRTRTAKHLTKTYRRRTRGKITHIAVHHSATLEGSAEAFARYHVNTLGWPGIGYHYIINKDGTVDQCHDLEVVSYHVGNSNGFAVGICLVGDFRQEEPTKGQWTSLYSLLAYLKKELNIPTKNILGHQEFPEYDWKPCPSLDMNDIRKKADKLNATEVVVKEETDMLMKKGDRSPSVKTLQENLNKLGYNVGAADGIFGQKTEEGVKAFQRATGLVQDGIAGTNTLNKLKAILKPEQRQVKESVEFTIGGKKYRISEV